MKVKYALPLIVAVLLAVVLVVTGCVGGLAPIGWSGGTVVGGELYIGAQGRLVGIDLADESRQFSDAIQAPSSPGLFGCSAGTLGCGSTSAGVPIYGSPVVSDNLVYIAGYNGKIYAYNTGTLQPRWVYPREGYLQPFVGGLVESAGKLFIGGSEGVVYALDAATGDELWDFPTGDKVWATGAVAGDTLYIGSFDDNLYALNTADGKQKVVVCHRGRHHGDALWSKTARSTSAPSIGTSTPLAPPTAASNGSSRAATGSGPGLSSSTAASTPAASMTRYTSLTPPMAAR